MAIPYKPFDWNSFPKDAKVRFLEPPQGSEEWFNSGFMWTPRTWKLTLPGSANLYEDCGCGDGISDEVMEWMNTNLHGLKTDPTMKGQIWRDICPITQNVTYECSLYSERDFILFKMRFQ